MSRSKIYVRLDGAEYRQSFSFLIEIIHLQPLELRWMQPSPSFHLDLLTPFVGNKGNPQKRPVFVSTQANLWLSPDRTSHLDQPPSIFSCQGTVTVPPTPPSHPKRILRNLCSRRLLEDRQTDGRLLLSFIAFPEDFRGTVVSAEALWMLTPPPLPKPPHHTSSALEMKRRSVPCF